LGRRLCHIQLLGNTFARHIARLPQRRRETSLQASRWILDKGDIGQPRTVEPRPQLKPLLQRLPVLLVGRIFNGDSVVTFAALAELFGLALSLLWNIYMSRRGSGVRDKLRNVILQQSNLGEHDYSNSISTQVQRSSATNLVWKTRHGVLGD
jgi:hypothetical protein